MDKNPHCRRIAWWKDLGKKPKLLELLMASTEHLDTKGTWVGVFQDKIFEHKGADIIINIQSSHTDQ